MPGSERVGHVYLKLTDLFELESILIFVAPALASLLPWLSYLVCGVSKQFASMLAQTSFQKFMGEEE
jgi:hypothetical protein